MTVLTGDDRFEQAQPRLPNEMNGGMTMCEVLDRAEAKGETKAINLLTALFAKLRSTGRSDDLDKALADREYLLKLMQEFQK